jgi:hypothetical protein
VIWKFGTTRRLFAELLDEGLKGFYFLQRARSLSFSLLLNSLSLFLVPLRHLRKGPCVCVVCGCVCVCGVCVCVCVLIFMFKGGRERKTEKEREERAGGAG